MTEHDWQQIEGASGYKSLKCASCGIYSSGSWDPPSDAKPCPGGVRIFVRVDADYTLTVGEVWPDGDYPAEITAQAVAAVMRENKRDLSLDWGLTPEYLVSVGRGPEVMV